jgi:hypothetical protein
MTARNPAARPAASPGSHVLRFDSLFHPGRGVAVPCDASGHVDLDQLSERLRNAYLGARAMVGREYACPTVQQVH